MLSLIDPIKNEIFFDADTIGIAIAGGSEVRTLAFDYVKKAISSPVFIIEISPEKRVHLFARKSLDRMQLITLDVEFQEGRWYAKELDIEAKSDFVRRVLNNPDKIIYSEETLL